MDQQGASFPEIKPFDSRQLAVGEGHSLYVEQVGNPSGRPALFLHGGPGSGCQPAHRRLFDPARFRVVLFDQRGAGRSTPKGCLEANTTAHLIRDIEQIRKTLGIERWLVVGGSWGSLLGLAYAQAHPERVAGLVLRAILLGEGEEIDWAFTEGPKTLRPELWRAYRDLLPAEERDDPVAAYGARLTASDPKVRAGAARIWHDYERALSSLQPSNPSLPATLEAAEQGQGRVPATPFSEWHYIRHGFFLEPGEILSRADRLAEIPGILVQGRYDLLCPPLSAHRLVSRWPRGTLRLAEASGHGLEEPAVGRAVMAAIAELGQGDT